MSDPAVPEIPTADTDVPEQSAPAGEAATAPALRRRRRLLIGAAAAALVAVVGAGGAVTAHAHKVVELDVDGDVVASSSFRGSVAGFLEENGVELGEHDEVSPSLDSPLRQGENVTVLRAAPVNIVVDGEDDVLWTTADDAGAALAAFGLEGRDVQMAVSRSTGRSEMDLPLSERTSLTVDGGTQELELEPGTTLAQALENLGLTLADLDEITVTSEPDGTSVVTIVRVVVSERVENEAVPFTSREEDDATLLVGRTAVVTEGVDGNIERRYSVTTRDGVEVAADLTSEGVTVEMVEQVTAIGTKPKPKPVPAPAPARSSAPSSSGSSGGGSTSSGGGEAAPAPEPEPAPAAPSGDVWGKLAQCESGGNPSIISSNGKYHGLYQFTVSTWQSVGGSGLPSDASPAEQTERAQALQARSGWGQWPACARKLGLR
ncbi:resuscitation-promoting factor [Litorihabitans aurantiacus]|uniref:Resuscitation-promoting factor n=1 Tax=Litorihabitans aurantiacus TaxID=1930061 RepID=A0AA37USA8_9MICO|nr:resuscitation-promoting factor [Litorihabitans aurantiacus]GMA30470.1 resuscitation-promoting factor [Litorihabitans aurantiacus]